MLHRSIPLLIVGAMVLLLAGVAAWAGVPDGPLGSMVLIYPLPGMREVDINLWLLLPDLRVTAWYQDMETGTNVRLLAFTLPLWLLILGEAMLAAVANWFVLQLWRVDAGV